MSAGILDITIEQGARFEMLVTVNDSLGAPIDLTGATFEGQVREAHDAAASVAAFQFTIQNQTTNKGQVSCYLRDAVTATIPVSGSDAGKRVVQKYLYDISYHIVDGYKVRLLQGVANVSGEVTK
jgi:hypothetical protein